MVNEYSAGMVEARIWGYLAVTDSGTGYCVKRLRIGPGAMHSLHRHRHRDEYWVIVSGKARVTHDGKEMDVETGGSVHLKAGTLHRIANPGTSDLIAIEVQIGSVLAESDIERVEPAKPPHKPA